jgi:hypothetical protein
MSTTEAELLAAGYKKTGPNNFSRCEPDDSNTEEPLGLAGMDFSGQGDVEVEANDEQPLGIKTMEFTKPPQTRRPIEHSGSESPLDLPEMHFV